jgi:adenylylsulfate kinase
VETHLRSIVKATTWRIGGLLVTFFVALAVTRKFEVAVSIGLADTVIKLAAYYVHERAWLKVGFGRIKPSDYQI